MFALLICQDEGMWTIMPWLFQLQSRSSQGIMFAGLLMVSILTFLVFTFCQSLIMRGMVVPVEKYAPNLIKSLSMKEYNTCSLTSLSLGDSRDFLHWKRASHFQWYLTPLPAPDLNMYPLDTRSTNLDLAVLMETFKTSAISLG